MPSVHEQKARKDQGECSRCGTKIKKGQRYKWAKGRYTVRRVWCSHCQPRASELTGSDKLSRLYAARESIEDVITGECTKENLIEALSDAASEAREVGQEYQESHDAMPDNFQMSATGEELQEKADQCEQWADALESAVQGVDALDWDETDDADRPVPEDEDEDKPAHEDARTQAEDIANGVIGELEL